MHVFVFRRKKRERSQPSNVISSTQDEADVSVQNRVYLSSDGYLRVFVRLPHVQMGNFCCIVALIQTYSEVNVK